MTDPDYPAPPSPPRSVTVGSNVFDYLGAIFIAIGPSVAGLGSLGSCARAVAGASILEPLFVFLALNVVLSPFTLGGLWLRRQGEAQRSALRVLASAGSQAIGLVVEVTDVDEGGGTDVWYEFLVEGQSRRGTVRSHDAMPAVNAPVWVIHHGTESGLYWSQRLYLGSYRAVTLGAG